MSLQVYLAFVAACIALALLPGPMVTLVIANGLRHGSRAALTNIAGAQLAWQHARFVTTLYGTNLTNQHYVAALNSGLNFAGPPRQYGLRFMTSF